MQPLPHAIGQNSAPFTREQVEAVLNTVRPALRMHGGEVDLVCVEGCNVRVALRGACVGCPSSTSTLRFAIEKQLREELAGFGELLTDEPTRPTEARKRWWQTLIGD